MLKKTNTLSDWQKKLTQHTQKKMTEPLFITTTLTPDDADILLESNSYNRYVKDHIVTRYAHMMRENKWLVNGECIKVAPDRELLDGQHRLLGVKEFGEPVRFSMALGVPKNTFAVNDTGKARNSSDILGIAGYQNTTLLAAALRYFLWYKSSEAFFSHRINITPSITLEAIKKWPHMQHFVKHTMNLSFLGPKSGFLFFIYVTQTIDPEASLLFFNQLETGENLSSTSPVFKLRNYLINLRVKQLTLDKRLLLGTIICAWNAFYLEQKLQNVQWNGKNFPVIAGVDRKKLFLRGSGFGKYTEN